MLARVKERVQFVSNGLELAGVLQLPDGLKKGERRAAFLVLHGFGSNKDGGNVVTVSNLLTGLGYATLRFDMRGCGDSQGARGRTICLEQVEDTRAALDYLSRNENVDTRRIGVIGHSFGAAVAVYAAGVDSRIAACASAGGWGNGVKKFRKQHESPEAWAKFQGMLGAAGFPRGRGAGGAGAAGARAGDVRGGGRGRGPRGADRRRGRRGGFAGKGLAGGDEGAGLLVFGPKGHARRAPDHAALE